MSNTLVFTLSDKNNFSNISASSEIKNYIADLSGVGLETINLVQNNFVKFGALVKKGNGSFLIVSDINFDENLNIVPTLQEAYDFIDMEEMERQLN
ncbi:MAG: hypothetical protein ACKVLD_05355 [Flavobacteriales bacterium]|jgi:hypothetical protein|tara:strand:- start:6847 stop:7134 length:288 start_codon:yes stop_codon:yes gene_type:complete